MDLDIGVSLPDLQKRVPELGVGALVSLCCGNMGEFQGDG